MSHLARTFAMTVLAYFLLRFAQVAVRKRLHRRFGDNWREVPSVRRGQVLLNSALFLFLVLGLSPPRPLPVFLASLGIGVAWGLVTRLVSASRRLVEPYMAVASIRVVTHAVTWVRGSGVAVAMGCALISVSAFAGGVWGALVATLLLVPTIVALVASGRGIEGGIDAAAKFVFLPLFAAVLLRQYGLYALEDSASGILSGLMIGGASSTFALRLALDRRSRSLTHA